MATILIEVDGNDITDDVIYKECEFISMANGRAGNAKIRVRDDGHTYSFVTGTDVRLVVNGDNVWRGFLSQVNRVYPLTPMDTTTPSTVSRFFDLVCVDINVLFAKRVVYHKSQPTDMLGHIYNADTADDVAIELLVSDYLDLSGDGLNTETVANGGKVENVANINDGQPARPFGASVTWQNAMDQIAMLPAAVYYIDPDKNLVYTDVDTPNAPFDLSDVAGSGGSSTEADDFDRTVGAGDTWGTGPFGLWERDGQLFSFSVDGDEAIAESGTETGSAQRVDVPTFMTTSSTWEYLARFKWPVAATVITQTGISFDQAAFDYGISALITLESGDLQLDWYDTTTGDTDTVSAAAPESVGEFWAFIELQVDFDAGETRARYWKEGDPTPAWQAELTNLSFDRDTILPAKIQASMAAIFSSGNHVWRWSSVGNTGSGASTVAGYRQMEIIRDAGSMANDFLAWGLAQTPVVFSRVTSSTSVTEHGLWQDSRVDQGIYKQTSISRVASSMVDGSTQSKRGRKNDKLSVRLTTFTNGFRVAEKARVVSSVWDFDEVLPIRQSRITFPTPTDPKYELLLSHEIDAPWGFFDPIGIKPPKPPDKPPIIVIPPPPLGCSDAICGITDTFDRADQDLDGSIADSGSVWTTLGGTAEIVSNALVIHQFATDIDLHGPAISTNFHCEFDFSVASLPTSFNHSFEITAPLPMSEGAVRLQMEFDSTNGAGGPTHYSRLIVRPSGTLTGTNTPVNVSWVAGQTYHCIVDVSTTAAAIQVVGLGTATATYSGTLTDAIYATFTARYVTQISGGVTAGDFTMNNLDVTGNTRCTAVQFDDFGRTVTGGWGSATPSGAPWTVIDDAGGFIYFHVADGSGISDTNASPSVGYSGSMRTTVGHALTVPWEATFSFQHDAVDWSILSNTYSLCSLLITVDDDSLGGFIEVHQQAFGANVLGHPAGRTFFGLRAVDADSDSCGNALNGYVDLPSGGTVNYRLRVESDNLRLKGWIAGTAEPETWTVVASSAACGNSVIGTVAAALATPSVTVFVNSIYGNTDVYRQGVDYIDFDYAGRPCYGPCNDLSDDFSGLGTALFDCFPLSPLSHNDLTWFSSGGSTMTARIYQGGALSNASGFYAQFKADSSDYDSPPTGHVKANDGRCDPYTQGTTIGGTLTHDVTHGIYTYVGGTSRTDSTVVMDSPISPFDCPSWDLYFEVTFAGTVASYSAEQMTDSFTGTHHTITVFPSATLYCGLAVSTNYVLGFNLSSTFGEEFFLGSQAFAFPITGGVTYGVRAQGDSGIGQMRVWDLADPEPSTWDIEGADIETDVAFEMVAGNRRYADDSFWIKVQNLVMTGPEPVLPGSGVPLPGSYQGETATRIDATHYSVLGQIAAGSEEVTVNGLSIAPPNYSVAGNIVTFAVGVTEPATVLVRYTAGSSVITPGPSTGSGALAETPTDVSGVPVPAGWASGSLTLQQAIDAASPGSILNLSTVRTVQITTPVIINKPLTIVAYGMTITAPTLHLSAAISVQDDDVTLEGFVGRGFGVPVGVSPGFITGWEGAAIQIGAFGGFTGIVNRNILRNLDLSDCQLDLVTWYAGTGHRMLGCLLSRSGRTGLNGSGGSDWGILRNRFTTANTGGHDIGNDVAGSKLLHTNGLLVQDNEFDNNSSIGFWTDTGIVNLQLLDNRIHNNLSSGIFLESSHYLTVRGNRGWHNNNRSGVGAFWGGGLVISSSDHFEVIDHVEAYSGSGYSVVSQYRTDDDLHIEGYIHDSLFVGPTTSGYLGGWFEDISSTSPTGNYPGILYAPGSNNHGANNRYGSTSQFRWTTTLDLAGYNATPAEEGGVYLTAAEIDAALTAAGVPH